MWVIRVGTRLTRRNVDVGSGLFVGVLGGDRLCGVGVRTTRQHKGVGSEFFVGIPGEDRPYEGPVDSLGHRRRVQILCRDTRWEMSSWGSGRLVDVGTVSELFVEIQTGGRGLYKGVRSVRRNVYGPESLSGCPTVTVWVWVRSVRPRVGVVFGLFGSFGGGRLYVGPFDSSVSGCMLRFLYRGTRQVPPVLGLVYSSEHRIRPLCPGHPTWTICSGVQSVLQNTGVGLGLFTGTSGWDRLYRGPVDSSPHGRRTRILCRGVR